MEPEDVLGAVGGRADGAGEGELAAFLDVKVGARLDVGAGVWKYLKM